MREVVLKRKEIPPSLMDIPSPPPPSPPPVRKKENVYEEIPAVPKWNSRNKVPFNNDEQCLYLTLQDDLIIVLPSIQQHLRILLLFISQARKLYVTTTIIVIIRFNFDCNINNLLQYLIFS